MYSAKILLSKLKVSNRLSSKNVMLNNYLSINSLAFKRFCNKEFSQESKKRDFGYQYVDKSLHQNLVNQVFENVANKYDLMNDVMSLGVHRLWKTEFVNKIGYIRPNVTFDEQGKEVSSPLKIIDVAGGTGDISYKILAKANEYYSKGIGIFPVDITVVDINAKMLEEGRLRAQKENVADKLQFVECNAETLHFVENESIDLYTISFGIRNCTNRDKVLKEAFRVLKKGGRFMCLEFSQVTLPVLNQFYDWYSEAIIPELGGIFANDKDSYVYLVESIRKFPKQEEFKQEIEIAGFKFVNYTNLSAGICAIHSGTKL